MPHANSASKKRTSILFAAALAASACAGLAHAQATSWVATTGNWSTSGNWNPANVPDTITEIAIVDTATDAPTVNGDFDISRLSLSAGQVLGDSVHSLTLRDLLDWSGSSAVGTGATIHVLGSGSLASSSTLTNLGTVNFDTSSIFVGATNVLNNAGTITVNNGSLTLRSSTNSGWLEARSNGTIQFAGTTLAPGTTLAGNGTFAVAGTANLQTTVNLSNLQLSGTLVGGTLTTSGRLQWNSGAMTGAGLTTVASTSTLHMASASDTELSTRKLVNNGSIVWSGAGIVNLRFGAKLQNNGVIDATGNATIQLAPLAGSGTALLENNGLLRKSAGGGTSTIWLDFENNGTVSVSSGTLSIQGGGTGAATSRWEVSSGATLRFASGSVTPIVLDAGAAITNSGTVINAGFLSAPAATLAGSNVVLDAVFGELNVDGDLPVSAFTWNRGVLSGPGTSTTAGMTIADDWGVAGGRVLENSGAINWTAGQWAFGFQNFISAFDSITPGTIGNLSSGVFGVQVSGNLGVQDLPELLVVNNAGELNVAAGQSVTVYGSVDNSGSIVLDSGAELEFAFGSTSSGSLNGAAGSTFKFAGSQAHSISGPVATLGTLHFVSAETVVTGSTSKQAAATIVETIDGQGLRIDAGAGLYAGAYSQTGRLTLNGGILNTTGAAQITSGGVYGTGSITSSVISTGGFFLPGDDSVAGDTSTIHIGGGLALDENSGYGVDIDAGTLANDLITVGGMATLGGEIAVVIFGDASLISPSHQFVILTAGSVSGQFLHHLDGDRVFAYDPAFDQIGSFHVVYTGTEVILTDFVPEPGGALSAMIVAGLLMRRRASGAT